MTYRLKVATALLMAIAGVGSGFAAGDSSLPGAVAAKHYSDIERGFFAGSGLASGAETYASAAAGMSVDTSASPVPSSGSSDAGQHYSLAEYLFFTSAGFDSTAMK